MYSDKKHTRLPRFVRLAYDKGYDLGHVGLLCYAATPPATIRPRARLRFIAVEGLFTAMFYTTFASIMDAHWTGFMPWSRDAVSWGPTNSHSPLNEGIGDSLQLDAVQLAALDAARLAHKFTYDKAYHATLKAKDYDAYRQIYNGYSRAHYQREREKDLDAFLAKGRASSQKWADKNREKVRTGVKQRRKKAKADRRFTCDVCDLPLDSPSALKKHRETDGHKLQVGIANGTVSKPQPSAALLASRKCQAKAKAEKKNFCHTCQKAYMSPAALTIHYGTAVHKRKADAALHQSPTDAALDAV